MIGAALLVQASVRAAPADQPPAVDSPLAPGEPTEFELGVGASRRHPLTLDAGQFLYVELRENGPRVVLSLVGPRGHTVARREASAEAVTSYRLFAIADVGGRYALEVHAFGQDGPGSYDIRVDEPHPASERERALAAADDALAEAVRLANEGNAESRRRALARLDAAEAGFAKAGDRLGRAFAVRDRGIVLHSLRDPAGSDAFERALGLFRDLGNKGGVAAALNGLGQARYFKSELHAALDLFERAAAMAMTVGDRRALSNYLSAAGAALEQSGWAERAIDRYTRALALATEAGSRKAEARALNNMGVAYQDLGEKRKALECYEAALPLQRGAGSKRGEVVTLGNISNLHFALDDDVQALAFFEEALRLAQVAGFEDEEAHLLKNVSKVYRRLGEYESAVEACQRSLELWRQLDDPGGEAATLDMLGRSLHASGDTEAALRHLHEGLQIVRRIGGRFQEAETLLALARVERDRGNLSGAVAHADACIVLTESLREALTNPDLRGAFLAAEEDKYGLYIDLLMRLHEQEPTAGYDATALQTSERARARILLDALIEARADIRQGVDPSLLDRERALQKELTDAGDLLSRGLVSEGATQEVAQARRAFEAKSDEYRLVQAQIRRESPRYAALTQPVPATLEEIRRDVLDDETVLLEFSLGDERSFLWTVTRSELFSQALPGRAQIEAAARKLHALLTERQRTRAAAAVQEADRQLESESMALSRLLLAGIAPRLATDWKGKRLLVVASGALAYLPFGALPSPATATPRPLLLDHEIVYAPSASVLVALRQERDRERAAPRTLAVLADPVFEATDPRVRAAALTKGKARPAPATGLTRAMDSLGQERFGRLPFSRHEANAIAMLVPRRSLLKATDFQANRALVADRGLGDRRIVHFATHGLLNSEHPDLSGLVLSLVDETGSPRDGFLRMHEIYNLRLPADLVVLSACQSALGREIRGEGLVGLTRGFMYAGARRVVASLWQVDDESTAELMKRFYRAMLKNGRPPAAALREAQLELSRDPRWASPFHWAGFVLQGEWR